MVNKASWCERRLRSLVMVCFLCVSAAACSDDASPAVDSAIGVDAGPDGVKTADSGGDALPDQPDLQVPDAFVNGDSGIKLPTGLQNSWNVIYPGGKTICSRGDKYMFAVHPGTENKLVVDFEGGGACWTDASCGFATALFKERAEDSLKYIQQGYSEGIYDRKNPQNPFKDWFHVFVPYCTGDIHWGDAVTTYGSGATAFDIRHKGAVNARAVLKWISDNFGGPEKIFVTGCSAGSYGSLLWAHHLIKAFPQSKVYQFGDSGAGVVTKNFLKDSFPNWNALQATPDWIPTMDPSKVDLLQKDMAYLYTSSSNAYTDHIFTQYNTYADKTQVTYFQVMGGGTAEQWTDGMIASVDSIIKTAPGFRAFLDEGDKHCIIPYKELYTAEVNGKKLVDWLQDMVDDKPIQNERCATCVPSPPGP